MDRKQIKDLALAHGFKLKAQDANTMDLNPYVYEFAEALIAKDNERVRELEQELKESDDDLVATQEQSSKYENTLEEIQGVFCDRDSCPLFEPFNASSLSNWLNKFAIENQIKGAEALICAFPLNASDQMREWLRQLRKEQSK